MLPFMAPVSLLVNLWVCHRLASLKALAGIEAPAMPANGYAG